MFDVCFESEWDNVLVLPESVIVDDFKLKLSEALKKISNNEAFEKAVKPLNNSLDNLRVLMVGGFMLIGGANPFLMGCMLRFHGENKWHKVFFKLNKDFLLQEFVALEKAEKLFLEALREKNIWLARKIEANNELQQIFGGAVPKATGPTLPRLAGIISPSPVKSSVVDSVSVSGTQQTGNRLVTSLLNKY